MGKVRVQGLFCQASYKCQGLNFYLTLVELMASIPAMDILEYNHGEVRQSTSLNWKNKVKYKYLFSTLYMVTQEYKG